MIAPAQPLRILACACSKNLRPALQVGVGDTACPSAQCCCARKYIMIVSIQVVAVCSKSRCATPHDTVRCCSSTPARTCPCTGGTHRMPVRACVCACVHAMRVTMHGSSARMRACMCARCTYVLHACAAQRIRAAGRTDICMYTKPHVHGTRD
jgi:hypothetical protein